jgi:RHS repeat-associated protein
MRQHLLQPASLLRVYSPFGAVLEGRSWSAESGYRYGFQAQEEDAELWEGAVNYKYRVEDPRLGRFFSVDPLCKVFPWNGYYTFSENRVIDSVELEGCEKVSIHTYSFAPFDVFGGEFHGDGANRGFGDAISNGRGRENYRIGATVNVDMASGQSSCVPHGSESVQYYDLVKNGVDKCFSNAYVTIENENGIINKWSADIHNYGANCTVAGSCDIDVYSGITMCYCPK